MFVCSKTIGGVGGKEFVCAEHTHESFFTRCLFLSVVNVIDPSAGSPTETLLRLLLPRNVQI